MNRPVLAAGLLGIGAIALLTWPAAAASLSVTSAGLTTFSIAGTPPEVLRLLGVETANGLGDEGQIGSGDQIHLDFDAEPHGLPSSSAVLVHGTEDGETKTRLEIEGVADLMFDARYQGSRTATYAADLGTKSEGEGESLRWRVTVTLLDACDPTNACTSGRHGHLRPGTGGGQHLELATASIVATISGSIRNAEGATVEGSFGPTEPAVQF